MRKPSFRGVALNQDPHGPERHDGVFPNGRHARVLRDGVFADIFGHLLSQDVCSSVQTPPVIRIRGIGGGVDCRGDRIVEINGMYEIFDEGPVKATS